MGTRIYNAGAGVLLLLLCGAQFTGWALADYDTVPDVPRTVRDNPGVYRSHYGVYYHARYGGK